MNPKVKEQWLKALRSDRYKQGRNKLRDSDNNFCCLGVLCDLHRKACRSKKYSWTNVGNRFCYLNETAMPPSVVIEWAGLASNCHLKDNICLQTLNDGYHDRRIKIHSFDEIADLIEKYL